MIWSLLMTLQTPSHRLINNTADREHILNISVTRLTRDFRVDMRNVIEEHTCGTRKPVHSLPLRFCLRLCVIQYLLNLGRVPFDLLMTESTFFRAGDQHMRRSPFTVFVTECTSDLQFTPMYSVTKCNRLHW